MTFNEFYMKISYFYNINFLTFMIFIARIFGKKSNAYYQKFFQDGHSFENWQRCMIDMKVKDKTRYNLFKYLPLVITILILITLIRYYI